MAAIYDKALKRKDFSGIIDKEKQKEEAAQRAAANGAGANTPRPYIEHVFHEHLKLILNVRQRKAVKRKNEKRRQRLPRQMILKLAPTLGKLST